jgi:DNA-binding beta-propeller fold protein YncE
MNTPNPSPSLGRALRCVALAFAAQLGLFQVSVDAQQPPGPPRTYHPGGLIHPPTKELIYVALPGTLEGSWDMNGNGIVVLDATNNYNFIKRIPTWNVPASDFPLQVSGMDASPATNMVYVAARGRMCAIDLTTEKMAWDKDYDGQGFERPQVAPDGSFMYVGSNLKDFWYVVNPATGDLITKVYSPLSNDAHNLNLSLDGKIAFMAPNGPVMGIADTTTNTLTKTITFPDHIRVFVINHDASLIYSNLNNLLGFVIVDVKSGKIIQKVEVQNAGWPGNWTPEVRAHTPHGCPSHGIALTPDEKELWLDDSLNKCIHIYDNTQMPPVEVSQIKTTAGPYWITMGIDGKLAYISSGDVIDVKTHKIVGSLKDEYGRVMHSEKVLDMLFANGKLVKVSNHFGNGQAPAAAAAALDSLEAKQAEAVARN